MGTHMRLMARAAVAVVAVALVAALTGPAAATPRGEDLREKREQIRRQAASKATELDTLRAEEDEVEQALGAIDANLAAEQALLADARRRAEQAEAELAAAKAAELAAEARIDERTLELQTLAVDAFIDPDGQSLQAMLDADDFTEAAHRRALVAQTAGRYLDVLDELRAARDDLEFERKRAEQATAAARDAQAEVAARVDSVQAARDAQATVVHAVNVRVERSLAEAANLEALDKQISAQLAEQARREAERAARAGLDNSVSGRFSSGSVPLRTVYGITVHTDIADDLEAMLDEARADGHSFGGGGYRNPEDQWRLRRAHCPDAANSPPSSCRPPTARPGQSMHEVGKAIDFTYNGSLIRSRSNAGFQWLSANAGSYGFRNLPSEPWHWSVNGN